MNLNEYIAEAIDGQQTGIRFLTFRTDHLGLAEAQEVIKAIGPYNGFVPGLVNEVLDQIAAECGHIGIDVGREYSPCLYIYPTDESKIAQIESMLSTANPDELGQENPYCVRAWWD